MPLSQRRINTFRIVTVLSFLVISYLSLAEVDYPVVESINDKLRHFLAFFYLAFILDFSFPQKRFGTGKVLALLCYGLMIEWIQYYVPHRLFSLFDLAADGTGIMAYRLSIPFLKRMIFLKSR